MFDELPETIPHKNAKKMRAIAGSAALQVVLVAAIIVVQMALPERLGEFQLLQTLYMAPPPPPPPALSETPQVVSGKPERTAAATQLPAVVQPTQEQSQAIAPTKIPNDIERIVESSAAGPSRPAMIAGGVPGGVAGGTAGGMFGGILGGTAVPNVLPPPSTGPVRVGGNVKQPQILHIEEPQYPPAAKRARIEGTVIVEATVTPEGNVEKVKVISGPPTLTEAAAQAVSHWKYEPTYLNGQPVEVILNARITFSLADSEK